ncbi:MAG: O-antigen ligase family protein, partial [Anaerolineae bacterium]|nr:O-antigen ligase family protein [Anaerolineae bacterium]
TVRRRDYRQALWMIAGVLVIVLLLTFSRGGLLSFGIGLGSFFAMRILGDEKRASIRKWLIPLVIIGGVGAVLIVTISQARSSGDEIRLDMYRSAIEITLDNPIIGVGVGNFGRIFREYRTPELARDRLASAHNLYLNSASETGFLGVAIATWLAGMLMITWWRIWKAQETRARKIRHEAVIGALFGLGAHSMVDVFGTTPLVSLIALLLAYSIVGHQTVLSERPNGSKLPALAGLIIVVGYGIFFFQTDRAYIAYLNSWRDDDQALIHAQTAQSLDPELNLYTLQIANLTKNMDDYQRALILEPTWDVGWMNLAYLYEQGGHYNRALEALFTAKAINPNTPVNFNIARIGETYGILDDEAIIEHYALAIAIIVGERRYLPLSEFWSETDLRREALRRHIEIYQDRQILAVYQLVARHFPDERQNFVPQNPQLASEWWVIGEYALSVENNPQKAVEAFSQAITINPREGDYYAGRARAKLAIGEDVTRDMNYATLLITQYESLPLLRAMIAERDGDTESASQWREIASQRVVSGEFAGVLYHGRVGAFDLPDAMLPPQ